MSTSGEVSDTAYVIVSKIIEDLNDRRGLKNEWRQIDSETRREIIRAWQTIVDQEIALGRGL